LRPCARAEALTALRGCQRRRRFLQGFATDPADFERRFVACTSKEVRDYQGAAVEMSSAEHFKQPWAQEAAVHYLQYRERMKRQNAQQHLMQRAAVPPQQLQQQQAVLLQQQQRAAQAQAQARAQAGA
jgi:hypothetical protein